MPTRMHSTAPGQSSRENIDCRLTFYAAGAAAAGVSLLALAQPAQASVVVTQANLNVTISSPAFIDLNADGKNDFEVFVARGGYDHSFYKTLVAVPLTGGKPVGGARGPLGPYGSALASGAKIGPSAHFSSSIGRGQVTLERTNGFVSGPTSAYTPYGPWGLSPSTFHYLGVKFLINGAYHYGWVQMYVSRGTLGLQAFIVEYAYETTAGKAISAGATAVRAKAQISRDELAKIKTSGPSLGMLAAGAEALPIWRRDESQTIEQPSTTPKAGE